MANLTTYERAEKLFSAHGVVSRSLPTSRCACYSTKEYEWTSRCACYSTKEYEWYFKLYSPVTIHNNQNRLMPLSK